MDVDEEPTPVHPPVEDPAQGGRRQNRRRGRGGLTKECPASPAIRVPGPKILVQPFISMQAYHICKDRIDKVQATLGQYFEKDASSDGSVATGNGD